MEAFKSIVMSGYYGFDNSGDDAILKAITKDLKKADEEIDITVLSNNPKKTKRDYGVNAVDRFKIDQVKKALKESSLLISGGGSLLQDVTSTRSLIYYLAIMSLAKHYKKPVMVYANGIGPINGRLNRRLTKRVLNKVDLITLRDKDSYDYVKEMGVTNEEIYITADPVYTLNAVDDKRVDEILKREGIPLNKSYIGVSIRRWTNQDNLIEVVGQAIDYITEEYDVEVIMIPMHYPEDLEISLDVMDQINNERCHVLRDEYNVEEIMGVINRLELIIAMRLHSLIYAARQEVPMVGISYDPKVDGILSSLGMDYMCHVEDLKYEDLIENIDKVWENREELREVLKVQDEELEKKALENVSMALNLLGDDK